MSGYPNQTPQWQGNPAPNQYPAQAQYAPPNQMYPQLGQYAPSQQYAQPAPGQQFAPQQYPQPGQQYQQPGQYAPSQPYPPQPGFAAFSYPGAQPAIVPTPSAPLFSNPGQPTVTPHATVEWIPRTPQTAFDLSDRAVVGGFEGHDHSPIWVIRARHEGDLIPGKLPINHRAAYVPWGGKENPVQQIEVCCARPDGIRWVECRGGAIPPKAVEGGRTSSGEPLYVGRAREQGSLTPGKVQPSHNGMYISFGGKEIAHQTYEIMCYA